MPIPDEAGTFPGAPAGVVGVKTTEDAARITGATIVGAATISTSLFEAGSFEGANVTRGVGALVAMASALTDGPETLYFLAMTSFFFCDHRLELASSTRPLEPSPLKLSS